MSELNIRYWSHGPHYQFEDSIVFITWRLAGTLPAHIMDLFRQLRSADSEQENDRDLKRIQRENARLFNLYQDYDLELANWNDPGFSLNDEALAPIVTGAFQFYARVKYELHAYCVMSNHVHILIRALRDENGDLNRVSDLVRSMKSFTAHEINKVLQRRGQLWDDFHFDRVIRDARNYDNVVRYILMNPVAAGLVDKPEQWRDSFFDPDLTK
jgi:REP element-mobilizing transposase RayT